MIKIIISPLIIYLDIEEYLFDWKIDRVTEMRPTLPEKSDVYQYDYIETLATISEIISKVISITDPKPLYDLVLKSMHDLLGLTEMFLNFLTVEGGKEVIASTYGFDSVREKSLRAYSRPKDWIEFQIREEYRVTKNGYLIDGEKWAAFIRDHPEYDKSDVYSNRKSLYQERQFPEQWHEGDFFKFVIRDEKGSVIGYLEIDDSIHPEVLPPKGLIEVADVFAQLIGIINRLRRQIDEKQKKRESTSILATLLSKNLMPSLSDSIINLERAEKRITSPMEVKRLALKSRENLNQSIPILKSAKQILEIESRPYSLLTLTRISHALTRWKRAEEKRYRSINIEILVEEKERYLSKLDNRFQEILSSVIDIYKSIAQKELKEIIIKVFKKPEENQKWIHIIISSKEISLEKLRVMKVFFRPKARAQPGISKDMLEMFMLKSIISDYSGTIDVIYSGEFRGIEFVLPAM